LYYNGIYKVSGLVLITENAEIKDGIMDPKNYMLVGQHTSKQVNKMNEGIYSLYSLVHLPS
jgi:hypothetical protein